MTKTFVSIRGSYEDEAGLLTRGTLDLIGTAGAWEEDVCGPITVEDTPYGELVTSRDGAWKFYPAAGELARINAKAAAAVR